MIASARQGTNRRGSASGRRARRAWLVALLCMVAVPAAPALAAPGDLELVSRADGVAGAKGDSGSSESSISADGRYVAFASSASNLDPDDPDTTQDVFVRDLADGTTTLVSRSTGAAGDKGDNGSFAPSISADGRYVAFVSAATNLDPDDTDSIDDVFVRDLQTDVTTLVSRATGAAGDKGDDDSFDPSTSADGRYVAFISVASNLDPDDTDGTQDVFVRDLQTSVTMLVSRATGAAGDKGDNDSFDPSISADGRYVAFDTDASNLDPDDPDATPDVFVRDVADAVTTLVSRATGAAGDKGDDSSYAPSISADGRYVAFDSNASNLDPDDTDSIEDVFVRDVAGATTTLVSRATGAAGDKGDDDSSRASISADGRYVAFDSDASNLDPDDTDSIEDVFVRDVVDATTTLVSRATGAAGDKGDDDSRFVSISGDGRFAAFDSNATNLHPDDPDSLRDVFRRELDVAASSYEDVVLADGPVGYWRLGEASGTVAVDSSGNANHGAYLNGALLGEAGALVGDSDTAALFDGVNDEVRVPSAASLDVGSLFTAEAWVKRSAAAHTHSLMSKGANGLQLVVMNAANANQVWLRKAGVTTIARSSAGVPADGAYHHVVATMSGPGTARIYVDGVDVTLPEPGQQLQVVASTALPLRVAGAGSSPVTLDELALYGGALSAVQVGAHHAAGTGP